MAYVTTQAVPLSLVRSQGRFTSIIKCSACSTANVPWLLRLSTKVSNQTSWFGSVTEPNQEEDRKMLLDHIMDNNKKRRVHMNETKTNRTSVSLPFTSRDTECALSMFYAFVSKLSLVIFRKPLP